MKFNMSLTIVTVVCAVYFVKKFSLHLTYAIDYIKTRQKALH